MKELDAVLKAAKESHNVELQACNTALNRKWNGCSVGPREIPSDCENESIAWEVNDFILLSMHNLHSLLPIHLMLHFFYIPFTKYESIKL